MEGELRIKDCIYRFVTVPPLCRAFMDRPEVQRLRRIKQLGVVNYVYPSAVHSRFEHSLGVMHLAGRVCEHLRSVGAEISAREQELVQLAGLLHDVGHMAFSHLFDSVLAQSHIDVRYREHEQRSVELLAKLNADLRLLTEDEQLAVRRMILGEHPPAGEHVGENPRPFLYEVVHDARTGLDVDKMDYLQRDAFHTGLPGFQPDYIIQNMLIDPQGRIGYRYKARNDICDLFLTRKRMFNNVYCHRTVLKIDRIVMCAIARAGFVSAELFANDWCAFDDGHVDHLLRQNPETRGLMEAIDTRRFAHACECRMQEVVVGMTAKLNVNPVLRVHFLHKHVWMFETPEKLAAQLPVQPAEIVDLGQS